MNSRVWRIVLTSVLVMGLANLLATYFYVQSSNTARQRQEQNIIEKLCASLDRLAVLKPPPGNPHTNPSRAYDQELHAVLAALGPDIGCPKAPAS